MRLAHFSGAIRLFQLFGVSVYLHWMWFFVAAVLVHEQSRNSGMNSWQAVAGIVMLYAIVLAHEFGHALACKSVGGTANTIVLWPLGGVAFVKPPLRPGAFLWSLVAGPLVNVLLIPVIWLMVSAIGAGWDDFSHWATKLFIINIGLLVFNMLPIYPLDGGQILQCLLWYVVGYVNSLLIAAFVGLVVGVIGGLAALYTKDTWLVIMAAFIIWQAWKGLRTARYLAVIERQHQGQGPRVPFEVDRRFQPPPTER